jgi:hypothetical protein
MTRVRARVPVRKLGKLLGVSGHAQADGKKERSLFPRTPRFGDVALACSLRPDALGPPVGPVVSPGFALRRRRFGMTTPSYSAPLTWFFFLAYFGEKQ